MLFRTSREVLDVPAILPDPTVPLLAAFYLALAKLRSNKNDQAPPGCRFRASSLQSIPRIFGGRTCVTCHQIERSQDAGDAADCWFFAGPAQEGDQQTVVVGRGNVRCYGKRTKARTCQNDANDPSQTLQAASGAGFADLSPRSPNGCQL
jgi:mono/diheme cytochrome c family protein